MSRARHLRPRFTRWRAASLVLVLVGVSGLTAALRSDHGPMIDDPALGAPPAAAAIGPSAAPFTAATPVALAGPAAVARSIPVALRIPTIGVDVAVSQLGLNPDHTVEVPTNYQQPGWFRLGPTPGQVGSAVILGHVDNYQGPAVFFRLRALHPGDRIEVDRADGSTVTFAVDEVAMYPKTQFPARQVYESRGYSALQLVTCGGTFDRQARSYRSNVVVYTSLVETTSR